MQVLHDVQLVIVFKYIFDIEGTKVNCSLADSVVED